MRSQIGALKLRERGFSYIRTYKRHRCDLLALGRCAKTVSDGYDFDNTSRNENALVFQYTIRGEGRFFDAAAGTTHVLGEGHALLVPLPSPTRYWAPTDSAWEFVYLYFTGDMAFYHVRQLVKKYGYLHMIPPKSRVVEMVAGMHARAFAEPPFDEIEACEALHAFLMELYRFKARPSLELPAEIARAWRHIDEHHDDLTLDIDRLAQVAGYSKFHFSRTFRRHTGVSPYNRIMQVRLRRALDLISTTDTPMKQVSRLAGFREYSYFCNAFKKNTGQTPGEARRNAQL